MCGSVKSCSVLHLRTNSESSETSDILYSLSCSSSDLSSYLPCSAFAHPCLFFLSDPFLFVMRLLTMLTQPHVPAVAPPPELRTCSSSRTPIPVPAPPLDSELLPVFKPAVSIDTNQSDYCVHCRLIASYSAVPFLRSVSFCKPPPTNSLFPDSVRLQSPTSRNYRTYR